jgi:dipeptidyl aminopeptidase/acylaminoacyl peptidase
MCRIASASKVSIFKTGAFTVAVALSLASSTVLMAASQAADPAGTEKSDAPGERHDEGLFNAADIFALETVGDVRISPDGRRIVYVRNSYDIMTDAPRANLWIVNADGGGHRPLRSDGDKHFSPRWSPDGTRIAFVSTAEGAPQLFVRWMDSGQTALLTNLTEAPGSIVWSPDGESIAFTQFVPGDAQPLAKPPKMPEGAKWAPPVSVVDRVVYRFDGEGYLKAGFTHVFLVSADGGAARQLTRGDFHHDGPLSFAPDGKTLYLSANRKPDADLDPVDSEIYAVDVDSGAIRALTARKGPDNQPVVSPDGSRIAYLGFDDRQQSYQQQRLYVMNADGSGARLVSGALDLEIEDPVWAADGRSVYVAYDQRGVRKVGRLSLDGRLSELASGVGSSDIGRPYTGGGFSVSNNGRLAFAQVTDQRPGDVAVAGSGGVRRLTALNEDVFGHKQLGKVQRLTWTSSHDGRQIEGWLVAPPRFDPDKKYPLILEIHGGPHTAYGPIFSVEVQRYAAAGYMVLYTNPRGSTSYGEDFANAIHLAYPGYDHDDLMSGVDAAIAKGNVDTDNLFVTGGSGGGVLTAWIVGKTDRFRAAVVAKPVINWTSFALTADIGGFIHRYWFKAPPWEDQADYWRRSPLSLVGNVKTPTMLITGEADYRTPMSETEQYYQALKIRKVPTAMVRMPEASHGMTGRPSQFIAKIDNILAWFDRYRKK